MESKKPETNKTLTPEMEFSEKLTFRDYLIAMEQKENKPLPIWRLVAPLLLQVGLILAVPTQAMYTDVTGKTVILQTTSVNADDILLGNSLNLNYDIDRPQVLRKLPGWNEWVTKNSLRNRQINPGSTLYLILQEQRFSNNSNTVISDDMDSDFSNENTRQNTRNIFRNNLRNNQGNSNLPRVWRPVRVSSNLPNNLSNNQVALKGRYQGGYINYGLDNYYLSDQEKRQINNNLAQVQDNENGRIDPILVKIKVDPQGNAAPMSMWIGDRNYRFE
ncbi:GDYXXLXY domain-containing protein [Anabaena sp. FACHB-1237]|uniref:GDYXXLXY domain-containing protein n=1 Tax=Anabaena sp. FACHB-1237 TaxID=2692769 RepID=UPI001680B126|nr:GDYXXLXY domain-containing protein [Anabaena sp. FACHB-1237]MBD2136162.1 GDYXXLXY domain-containing protein [Anabaena sp. FACHB-1237]